VRWPCNHQISCRSKTRPTPFGLRSLRALSGRHRSANAPVHAPVHVWQQWWLHHLKHSTACLPPMPHPLPHVWCPADQRLRRDALVATETAALIIKSAVHLGSSRNVLCSNKECIQYRIRDIFGRTNERALLSTVAGDRPGARYFLSVAWCTDTRPRHESECDLWIKGGSGLSTLRFSQRCAARLVWPWQTQKCGCKSDATRVSDVAHRQATLLSLALRAQRVSGSCDDR
jgi:hypothetical protein